MFLFPWFVDCQEALNCFLGRSLLRKTLFFAAVLGSAGVLTSQTAVPTPQQMVEALHTTFGQHHAHAVHAKGLIIEGYFLPANAASRITTAPHPTAVETFLQTHPIARTFLTTQKPAPVSWATSHYSGVNSFQFTNAAGECRWPGSTTSARANRRS